jgi:uncharacterized membrane protein YdbT with pleckstrin-like domain
VTEIIIHPTTKFVKAGAIALAALVAGAEIAYFVWMRDTKDLGWAPAVLPLILLWPAVRWFRRRFTKATISGDRLRYETGITSKSTRTIQLSKIQDVRVDQSLMQRLLSVGDISIETAGETSRLTIQNVDNPQQMADDIMNLSHHGAGAA